jgi:glucose-1-phosphate adenylyltransferase
MTRPVQDPIAVILAGGQGDQLSVLSELRAIASVPFGGKFRIIDFTLSNCVNSGIRQLMVLTQYRPISLHRHIGNGKPWDLDRLRGGVRLVSPYLGPKDATWDRGTADAVYRNLEDIVGTPGDTVLILGGDHIYKMDYRPMLDFHYAKNADLTLAVTHIPFDQASRFGNVETDGDQKVTTFLEKPANPITNQVSMGIYVFNKDVLIKWLTETGTSPENRRDFGRNILPRMIENAGKVFAYPFKGYWRDIGTVQSYYQANMELLEDAPLLDLYARDWIIYTRSEERPEAWAGSQARIENSLVAHGCQIRGQVIRSILSPGVVVEKGAIVRDSVIMTDCVIGTNAVVDRAVLDKRVTVGANTFIGYGDDYTPNKHEPKKLFDGVTLIGKEATLPAGVRVGRNCKIGVNLKAEQFTVRELASGETLENSEV